MDAVGECFVYDELIYHVSLFDSLTALIPAEENFL
jgi:hypothetical protein